MYNHHYQIFNGSKAMFSGFTSSWILHGGYSIFFLLFTEMDQIRHVIESDKRRRLSRLSESDNPQSERSFSEERKSPPPIPHLSMFIY